MASIIYQVLIDKKRKKCCITIELLDVKHTRKFLTQPSIHRITQ
jgi:hypothetical protein